MEETGFRKLLDGLEALSAQHTEAEGLFKSLSRKKQQAQIILQILQPTPTFLLTHSLLPPGFCWKSFKVNLPVLSEKLQLRILVWGRSLKKKGTDHMRLASLCASPPIKLGKRTVHQNVTGALVW